MRTMTRLVLSTVLALGCTTAVAKTTMSGTIMCAKCALKKADASKCQDVLVMNHGQSTATEYYIEMNAVAEEFGHSCSSNTKVNVTGEIIERDGKRWIAPSRIERVS